MKIIIFYFCAYFLSRLKNKAKNFEHVLYINERKRPKKGTPGPSGAKKGYLLKPSKKRTHEPCHWSKAFCTCFSRIKRRHTRVCLLCLTFNCFLSFCSQRSSIVPPYALYTNADARGDPLHLHYSHHATRATHVSARFAVATRIPCVVA